MMTAGTYSTPNICSITIEIRFACRSDQNLKSSISRASSSTVVSSSLCWQDIGMRDGSESKHRGTILFRQFLTETKSSDSGTSTIGIVLDQGGDPPGTGVCKPTVYFYRLRDRHNVVFPIVVIADLFPVGSGQAIS